MQCHNLFPLLFPNLNHLVRYLGGCHIMADASRLQHLYHLIDPHPDRHLLLNHILEFGIKGRVTQGVFQIWDFRISDTFANDATAFIRSFCVRLLYASLSLRIRRSNFGNTTRVRGGTCLSSGFFTLGSSYIPMYDWFIAFSYLHRQRV